MKTFYSILYATIRPNIGEKISIGLFIGNESVCKFEYSVKKLNIIKDLFSESAFNTLKMNLKSLKQLSVEYDSQSPDSYNSLSTLKEQYFTYLSKYSNNLITYSEPKPIDVEVNQEVFGKLFEKFIYELPPIAEPQML